MQQKTPKKLKTFGMRKATGEWAKINKSQIKNNGALVQGHSNSTSVCN